MSDSLSGFVAVRSADIERAAAIDQKHYIGDEISFVGGEEQCHVGDVPRSKKRTSDFDFYTWQFSFCNEPKVLFLL